MAEHKPQRVTGLSIRLLFWAYEHAEMRKNTCENNRHGKRLGGSWGIGVGKDYDALRWQRYDRLSDKAKVALLAKAKDMEAEVARLRPLAEVGEAVEGMGVGFGLSHAAEGLWLLWDSREEDDLDETCGPTALAALEALAALRVAKGEDDD